MFCTDRIVIAPEWQSRLHAHGLDSVASVYALTTGQRVASSGSTEVRRISLGDHPATSTVFIKKYWFHTAARRWSGMLRGTFFGRSKARCEYENLVRLRQWGFDAPAPVAYGEERSARWLTRSFLISEGVPNPLPLHEFIRDYLPRQPFAEQRRLRRELIERLAGQTRRLHQHRFVHHDFFWRNIILSGPSLERFALIDAHKGRRWRPWEEQHARAQDLAALDAPAPEFFRRTERLRFFLKYRAHDSLTRADKTLLLAALRLADPMREKQRRRVG